MARQKKKEELSQKALLQDESGPTLCREERAWRVAQLAGQLSLRFPIPDNEDRNPIFIAEERQDAFYEACIYRAEYILGYAAGTKGAVHAADLFEPEVLYTVEEITAIFTSYGWPGLTDHKTIGVLFRRLRDQVSQTLDSLAQKLSAPKVDVEGLVSALADMGNQAVILEKSLSSRGPDTTVASQSSSAIALTQLRKHLTSALGSISEKLPDPELKHLETRLANLEDLLDSKRGYFFHEIALICRDLGWERGLLIPRSKLKNPPVPRPAYPVPDHYLPRSLEYFEDFLAKLFGFRAHWRFLDWHPHENTGFLSHRSICPYCGARCTPAAGARTTTTTCRLKVFGNPITLKLNQIRLFCPQEEKEFRMPLPDYLENRSETGETAVPSSVDSSKKPPHSGTRRPRRR